jgi:hypothetical protein
MPIPMMNYSFGCVFNSLIYRLIMSVGEFSLDELDEDMVTLKLRQLLPETDRNKNMTRKRYTDLGQSGGYIDEN